MNLIKETKNAISYKNHIDMDGDYNPDYIMLINKAFNGNEQKIKWLKECASKDCLTCKTQLASKFMKLKNKIEVKEFGTVVPRSTNKKHTTFNSHEEKVNYIIKKFKGEIIK